MNEVDKQELQFRREMYEKLRRRDKIDAAFDFLMPAIVMNGILALVGWVVGLGFLWLIDHVWVGFAVLGITFELLIVVTMGWTVWQLGKNSLLW